MSATVAEWREGERVSICGRVLTAHAIVRKESEEARTIVMKYIDFGVTFNFRAMGFNRKVKGDLAGCILVLLAMSVTGCNRLTEAPSDVGIKASASVTSGQPAKGPDAQASPAQTEAPTPVKDALTLLFAKEAEDKDSPFPKGTHLMSVSIKEKQALVDVSKEFDGLKNRGERWEGLAQKKMCKALASFDNLETMHVTVEGKEYDSQAADWKNIPIRTLASGGASGQETGSTSSKEGPNVVERGGGVMVGGGGDR